MPGEAELLAEVEQILADQGERDLQAELGALLAQVHVLVACAWDQPETPESRATLQQLRDRLARAGRRARGRGAVNRPGVQYKAMAGPGELLGATLDGVGASGVASVRAVVATLSRIDGDGDVTVPGFFGRQDVAVVPVHDWNHVPIGKGLLYEQGDQAIADLKVNLAIPQARAWWEAFKFDLEHPPALQQWSYGFTVKAGGSFSGRFGGKAVRFL